MVLVCASQRDKQTALPPGAAASASGASTFSALPVSTRDSDALKMGQLARAVTNGIGIIQPDAACVTGATQAVLPWELAPACQRCRAGLGGQGCAVTVCCSL